LRRDRFADQMKRCGAGMSATVAMSPCRPKAEKRARRIVQRRRFPKAARSGQITR